MSKAQPLLRHIRFGRLVPFSFPQRLQDHLAREFLDHKALVSSASPPSPPSPSPIPAVVTFSPYPVYTTGRREHGTLSEEQLRLLKIPLTSLGSPEVWPTQRGGQTTFHGPGQIVFYPILDLKASYPLWPKGLTPRCYVNLLEETTIKTLSKWDLKGVRTENPGVWEENGEEKIAALGVHLRRNVTSYGVGLNVNTNLSYFDRIVACGLEDKRVTSMKKLALQRGSTPGNFWTRNKYLPRQVITSQDPTEPPLIEKISTSEVQGGDVANSTPRDSSSQLVARVHKTLHRRVANAWIGEFMSGLFGTDTINDTNRHDINRLDGISVCNEANIK